MIGMLAGCVQVPAAKILFGGASAYLPKDWKADHIKITLQNGTSNEMSFEATNIDTHNNPLVIGASTDQIKAHYEGAAKIIDQAIQAAEKGAAKAVVP